jgi:hypothetical protein
MAVNYTEPLSEGFNRMKKALFQPFDLPKWITIGFTAFLAGLTECSSGGGGGGNGKINNNIDDFNVDKFFSFPEIARDWLFEHPIWFALIIAALIFIFVIATILTWVSSRGKFMFLYNVVNNTDAIVKPWNDYRKQGNSLFWWQFFYGWLVFAVIILLVIYGFGVAKNIHTGVVPDVSKIGFIVSFVITIVALFVIFGYISLFLNDFVVPIMYKHKLSATQAWSKFLTLTLRYPGSFIVYGLFVFVLGIAVAIMIVFAAIFTCCIGLLLIMIPFVGSVILLPVSYTFRAFSIGFLAQFGDYFNVLDFELTENQQL